MGVLKTALITGVSAYAVNKAINHTTSSSSSHSSHGTYPAQYQQSYSSNQYQNQGQKPSHSKSRKHKKDNLAYGEYYPCSRERAGGGGSSVNRGSGGSGGSGGGLARDYYTSQPQQGYGQRVVEREYLTIEQGRGGGRSRNEGSGYRSSSGSVVGGLRDVVVDVVSGGRSDGRR